MRAAPSRLSPDTWAMLAIALAVVVANLPFWSGLFDPNPLHFRSGLTSSYTPGLLNGKPRSTRATGSSRRRSATGRA